MTNNRDINITHIATHCRLLDGVGPTESELTYRNLSHELGKAFIRAIRVRMEHKAKRDFNIITVKS